MLKAFFFTVPTIFFFSNHFVYGVFDFLNDILRLPKFNHFIILADAKKEPFEKVQGTKTTAGLLLMTCRGRLWQLNRPQREVDKPPSE